MRNKRYKLLLLILLTLNLVLFGFVFGYKFRHHLIVKNSQKVLVKNKIEVASDLIKKYEGFSEKIYICPAGSKTIGYGYSKSLKSFDKSVIIDEKDAELLLENEIYLILFKMKYSFFPSVYKNFTENQKSSVASLVYNIGETNFRKSKLYEKLKKYFSKKGANKVLESEIKKEWLGFHHYKDINNKVIKSVCEENELCLENRRREEIKLFFSN